MTNSLLLDSPPLVIQKELAVVLRSVDLALALQQVHFLTKVAKKHKNQYTYRESHWWVYNSYQQWKEDHFPFWSTTKIGRIFRQLEEVGLLVAKQLDNFKYDQRKWYRVDYDAMDIAVQNGTLDHAKMTPSSVPEVDDQACQDGTIMSETTPETTTESSVPAGRKKDYLDDVLKFAQTMDKNNDRPIGWREASDDEYEICKRVAVLWTGGKLPWATKDIENGLAAAYQILQLFTGDVRDALWTLDEFHAESGGNLGFTVSSPYSLRNALPAFITSREKGTKGTHPGDKIIRRNGKTVVRLGQ